MKDALTQQEEPNLVLISARAHSIDRILSKVEYVRGILELTNMPVLEEMLQSAINDINNCTEEIDFAARKELNEYIQNVGKPLDMLVAGTIAGITARQNLSKDGDQ